MVFLASGGWVKGLQSAVGQVGGSTELSWLRGTSEGQLALNGLSEADADLLYFFSHPFSRIAGNILLAMAGPKKEQAQVCRRASGTARVLFKPLLTVMFANISLAKATQ